MAHKKAGGTAKNLRDSNPKYLGIKLYAGENAKPGAIIVRQRGTNYVAGANTKLGKDHTVFATGTGIVRFVNKRKTNYDGRTKTVKKVDVLAS